MIWYLISNKEHRLWRSVTFEVFYPGGQNPWIPFHRLPFSEKLLFSYFLPVFVSRFFFDVLPPFEKYPIALQHTFTDIFGITQTVPSLRKLFTASLPMLYVILNYFGAPYGYATLYLRVISHYMNTCTVVLGIILKINM